MYIYIYIHFTNSLELRQKIVQLELPYLNFKGEFKTNKFTFFSNCSISILWIKWLYLIAVNGNSIPYTIFNDFSMQNIMVVICFHQKTNSPKYLMKNLKHVVTNLLKLGFKTTDNLEDNLPFRNVLYLPCYIIS